jgi:hypothetical protein
MFRMMMRKISLIVAVIAVVYYLTFLLFGQSALTKRLIKDSNSTYAKYRWTDSVSVAGNVDVETIGRMFDERGITVIAFHSDHLESIAKEFFVANRYNYLIMRDSRFKPYILVNESERMNEYVADWEKNYLWCFVFWIRIDNRMTGIS